MYMYGHICINYAFTTDVCVHCRLPWQWRRCTGSKRCRDSSSRKQTPCALSTIRTSSSSTGLYSHIHSCWYVRTYPRWIGAGGKDRERGERRGERRGEGGKRGREKLMLRENVLYVAYTHVHVHVYLDMIYDTLAMTRSSSHHIHVRACG
jgi:hypothetical protein